jgi:hypothetical protein
MFFTMTHYFKLNFKNIFPQTLNKLFLRKITKLLLFLHLKGFNFFKVYFDKKIYIKN